MLTIFASLHPQGLLVGRQHFVTGPADTHLLAVGEFPNARPRRLAAFGANEKHIGNVNRSFFFQNAAMILLRTGFRMPFYHLHLFDDDSPRFREDLEDFPDLTFVVTGDNLDRVILDYVHHDVPRFRQ